MADVLEAHMSGRQFVVGDRATVADFVLAYTLDWAKMAKVLNGLPRLEGTRGALEPGLGRASRSP